MQFPTNVLAYDLRQTALVGSVDILVICLDDKLVFSEYSGALTVQAQG